MSDSGYSFQEWANAAINAEYSRIIKVLEKPSKEWHSEGWEPCSEGDCYCDAIALIKGEK